MNFIDRHPSQTWEMIPLPDAPQAVIWVWMKPPSVPGGLIVRIPDEVRASTPNPDSLFTLRRLLYAAGIDPVMVAVWHLYGVAYEGLNGMSPYLDAAIPPPAAGVDPNIVVYINVPYVQPALPATAVAGEESQEEMFDRIAADWKAALEIESELTRNRKKLYDMFNKLKSLNRDLTTEERLHADSQDKREWTDARRWLRDCSTRLWGCIKEHDIGDTSAAGQRNCFEQIHEQFIVTRQLFDGLVQARRDFQAYRKQVLTLQINMNSAHSIAVQNGEQRAQRILTQIATKIREAKTKKNFLGVITD